MPDSRDGETRPPGEARREVYPGATASATLPDTLGHVATRATCQVRLRESRSGQTVFISMSTGSPCTAAWAHGVLAFFARPTALIVLVVLLALALARARVAGFGGSDIDQLAALLWAVIGAAVAYGISVPIVHVVGRSRPFAAIPQAVVLIARPGGFSFPNEHAVIAGALTTGLWLSRARLVAAAATVGQHLSSPSPPSTRGRRTPATPGAGCLLGILVSLALYPLAIGSLRDVAHGVARSPLKTLVGGGHHGSSIGPGPAAHPEARGRDRRRPHPVARRDRGSSHAEAGTGGPGAHRAGRGRRRQ